MNKLERAVTTVDYASAPTARVGGPRFVIGLLCWSVPLVLSVFSLLTWMRSSPAVVGVMALGVYVGLPCVPIGLVIFPRASRGRAFKCAWLPLLMAFAVIFGLGLSAEVD